MSKSALGFYLWGHTNVESADYVIGRMRESYPDSDLVISSDGGEDFSLVAQKHHAVCYLHGKESHGYPRSAERYGWTAQQARMWLERIYTACQQISNDYVMLMEEDVLVKERFRFRAADLVMIPNIQNGISPAGMQWVKEQGGYTKYPYYSAGGGTIISRKKFLAAYDNHIDSFTENYEKIYEQSMKDNYIGWGWNDSIITVLMYAEGAVPSCTLPIVESGNEDDAASIIHNFKKYYRKNLHATNECVLYYHAYLEENYKNIVQDQLLKIFISGLYKKISRLEICCATSKEENYQWLLKVVKDYTKIRVRRMKVEPHQYPTNFRESKLTLQKLAEDAKVNPGIYGYIHTKAVSNKGELMDNWRLSMDYSVILQWENCFTELKNGAYAVGPNLRYYTHVGYYPHFSGTYWWATSEHINSLDHNFLYDTALLGSNNHLLEEFWIGTSNTDKLKSIFECGHESPYLIDSTINNYVKEKTFI